MRLIPPAWFVLVLVLVLALAAAATHAQSSNAGAVSGVVTDESGAGLIGVTVVATSPALEEARSVITDGAGAYRLPDLPVGLYDIVFYYADSQVTRSGVTVSRGKTRPVHVRFNTTSVGEMIVIEDSAPTIDPTATKTGITLGNDHAKNIPIPGRSFEAALEAAAGSTGDGLGVSFSGSAGPWGTDYGTEQYERSQANPMIRTAADRLSTFAIDVDTASYSIARSKIESGERPHPDSVRVEEFLNYFEYEYEGPTEAGRPFAVHMDAAPSPFTRGRTLLRVGVQARRLKKHERKPANLVFLVDVSGSMSDVNKLELAKRSLRVLVKNLDARDTVALVTYAGNTSVRLEPTSAADKGRILAAIEELSSGGWTAMGAGIDLAYDLAARNLGPGTVSRVVVLSDGDANVGDTSHESILETIAARVDQGVTLTTVGFGMGNYKDHKMEQLANQGNGNNYYIDSISEARKVFGKQLEGTLEVVAKDVKIQVELNPSAVRSYRLVGYENRDIADDDFRDDKVDAGEIGAGHTVIAMYELELEHSSARIATVRIRSMVPRGKKASEVSYAFDRRNLHDRFEDASGDFRFASAVMAAAEILRNSPHARDWRMNDVVRIARAASRPDQADRQELIRLMGAAAEIEPYVVAVEPGYYARPSSHGGHFVAGASYGGLIVRGEASSNVAPISSLRLGYGRGATDITFQVGSSRSAAEATVARSSTPVGDELSFVSLATVVSHRFLPRARFHPVGGLGLESLFVTPSIGESRMALATLGRIGFEVVHPTSIGSLAFGFDATAHVPIVANERMPMNIDSLVTLGTFLDLHF